MEVIVDNVRIAQADLPVPLALENIAATLRWPESTIDEADFLTEIIERTDCLFLLDVANIYATCSALGGDPHVQLERMPLGRVAYVHVAGGFTDADGTYLDSHGHNMSEPVLELLRHAVELLGPNRPPVLLERDADVSVAVIRSELDRVCGALAPRTVAS